MPPPRYPPKVKKNRTGNPGVWGTAGRKSQKSKKPPVVVSKTVTPLGPSWQSQAESEADSIIAELLAELGLSRGSARAEAERSAQQEIARAQALSSAMMALGIPGQIQDIYGRSAGSISAMAGGFSQDTQALASQQGAEQANMVAGTGQEGAVRNEGAAMGDVLYGTQGFIPARGLEQMGAAFASEAALQPGFTMQFGQIAAAKRMDDYIKNVLPEFTDKEALIRSKRPSLVQDAKERRQAEALDLYKVGLLTQREFAKRMGVPNWRKFPNTIPSGEGDDLSFRTIGGSLFAIDPKTGKAKLIVQGPGPAPTVRTSGGYIWEKDPRTGKWVPVGGTGPAPPVSKGWQIRTPKDGSIIVFDPNTGIPTMVRPPQKVKPSSTLTAGQRAKYRSAAARFAADHYNGWRDDPTEKQIANDEPGDWHPPFTLAQALEELKKYEIPWALGKSILISYYRKHFIGPPAPKGKPGSAGRTNTAFVERAGFTASNEVVGHIQSAAAQYGIDPLAAMAVALAEGGLVYGAVGDNGDSHGPFQLNRNGALGRRSPGWANSPAGLRWAIQAMARAGARGLRGRAAIEAIVRYFERPADPDSEIARAISYYERLLGAQSV